MHPFRSLSTKSIFYAAILFLFAIIIALGLRVWYEGSHYMNDVLGLESADARSRSLSDALLDLTFERARSAVFLKAKLPASKEDVAYLRDRRDSAKALLGDYLAGVLHRIRHRLLGEQVATMPERGQREIATRRRQGDVENHVGPGLRQNRIGIGAGHRAGQTEFSRTSAGPLDIEVDKPDDIEAVDLPSRLEPGAAHKAATHDHCPWHWTMLLPNPHPSLTGGARHAYGASQP